MKARTMHAGEVPRKPTWQPPNSGGGNYDSGEHYQPLSTIERAHLSSRARRQLSYPQLTQEQTDYEAFGVGDALAFVQDVYVYDAAKMRAQRRIPIAGAQSPQISLPSMGFSHRLSRACERAHPNRSPSYV